MDKDWLTVRQKVMLLDVIHYNGEKNLDRQRLPVWGLSSRAPLNTGPTVIMV